MAFVCFHPSSLPHILFILSCRCFYCFFQSPIVCWMRFLYLPLFLIFLLFFIFLFVLAITAMCARARNRESLVSLTIFFMCQSDFSNRFHTIEFNGPLATNSSPRLLPPLVPLPSPSPATLPFPYNRWYFVIYLLRFRCFSRYFAKQVSNCRLYMLQCRELRNANNAFECRRYICGLRQAIEPDRSYGRMYGISEFTLFLSLNSLTVKRLPHFEMFPSFF